MGGISAASGDGFQIVINPEALETLATSLREHPESIRTMANQVMEAIVPPGAFGEIPNAQAAYQRLTDSLARHFTAIQDMGVDVEQFAARVVAAQRLAEQAEPVTRKVSEIPPPLENGPYGAGS